MSFLTASSNAVLRLFGDSTTFIEARVSPDELQQLVKEAKASGTVHPQVAEITSRALEFSELRAMDVMLPRREVDRGAILRAPLFVPERKAAVELLGEMRTRRQPFAIVVDEQGGYSGLVTLEDLVEELVGDFFNEHARQPEPFGRQPDGTIPAVGESVALPDGARLEVTNASARRVRQVKLVPAPPPSAA